MTDHRDQSGALFSAVNVSWVRSDPSARTRYSCHDPVRLDMNTIDLPSGDQEGCSLDPSPAMIQLRCRIISMIRSWNRPRSREVYASSSPLGDHTASSFQSPSNEIRRMLEPSASMT